jgi:hypothetical protein
LRGVRVAGQKLRITGMRFRGAGGCGHSGARASIRGRIMPIFHVQTTNAKFRSTASVQDYDSAEQAMQAGIDGAIDIAAEEVRGGIHNCALEVRVADLDNVTVLRSVVSLSAAPLLAA